MTIPEDIKRTAISALDSVTTFPDGTYTDEAYNIIARTILAERQRCAEVAKFVWKDAQRQGHFDIVKAVSQIRSRIDTGDTA